MTEVEAPCGLKVAATVLACLPNGPLRVKVSPQHGRPAVTRDISAEVIPDSLRRPDARLWVVLDSGANVSAAWKRKQSTQNEGPSAGDLAVGLVVALLWMVLKVWYREVVKKQYGFLSWPYLRADLISFAVLAIVGVVASWFVRHRHHGRSQ